MDEAINKLKNTAMGQDLVHNTMLKQSNSTNRRALLKVLNIILTTGYVPASWKEAVVIPLIKPGKDKKAPESYRPISLTTCLCKLYERIVHARLSWYIDLKRVLPNTQSGFRNGRSTTDNLVDLEQRIIKGWSERKKTYAVYLDMMKAFDLVWIPGLLEKLARICITENLLLWLKNFLLGRTFKVRIGSHLSEAKQLFAGVPQGSILSPLLFNIMLADLPKPSTTLIQILLYADDVTIDVAAETEDTGKRLLQPFLDVTRWAKKWRFRFAANKSSLITFSRDATCRHL